jgi:hypothetical protein
VRCFLDGIGGDLNIEASIFEFAYRERLCDKFGRAIVLEIDDVGSGLDIPQHGRYAASPGIELEHIAKHRSLLADLVVDCASKRAVACRAIDVFRGLAAPKRVEQDPA